MAKLLTLCRIHRQRDGVKLGKCADRAGHSQCPANDPARTPNKTIVHCMNKPKTKGNLYIALVTGCGVPS